MSRPQLRLLEAGSHQPLTLISATSGFGKTMLVVDWIHSRGQSYPAWLALDESDDQPTLLWRYFIAALRERWMGIGETPQAMLATLTPPAVETALATLVNKLEAMDEPLIAVIDNDHLIQSPDIHNSLTFFPDRQPENFQLFLLTREAPPSRSPVCRWQRPPREGATPDVPGFVYGRRPLHR